jgi:RNA-directed DNA polymerase
MSNLIHINLAWNTVRWTLVKRRVRRIQRRIYRSARLGHKSRVQWLQNLLINSIDAKLLAVQQVTTLNRGKRSAGIDGIKGQNLTDKEKLALIRSLHLDGKASPIRRVWIPKPGKTEKRPLGIPTISDRAKQALAKFALEPEWEAVFEPNSYGFRPARSAQDAIEAIFLSMRHNTTKWVFDADIRKCFDRINHDALLTKLDTFPEMEAQIKAWLKAGVMESYANSSKEIKASTMGTPQGGVISPLLANIALHGLENHLKNFVVGLTAPREGSNRGSAAKKKALAVIRYADDFVIIHENLDILNACIPEAKGWLANIGLEVSEEKSALRDGRKSFSFLGFQIIQVKKDGRYKVKITPSSEKQSALLKKVRDVIQMNKTSSAYKLVRILRPIIIGWANYYKFCECSSVFKKLTNAVFQKIRAWVFRRDTRNGRSVVRERYFPPGKKYNFKGKTHQDNWILCGRQKSKTGIMSEIFLPHMVWVASEKFVKVKGDKSPFDGDVLYWGSRLSKYEALSTRTQTLLKRQKMTCALCKQPFTSFDRLEVDHIIPINRGGKDVYHNLQLLHRHCHVKKTAEELST